MQSFFHAKTTYDNIYTKKSKFTSIIPVHLTWNKEYNIKNKDNQPNEEYYKWQFFCAIISSGLYSKDYIGAEVSFPKENKNSAPIRLDGAIFDSANWFENYEKYHLKKDQESLDWLRKHLLVVIEFKKGDSQDVEAIYNQQLKSALKESENEFCLGVLYDTERLYLFQKKKTNYLRLDESYNLKGDKSSIKNLSLHLTDAYYKLPSFEQLEKKITKIAIDRSKRTIDDLDVVTGVYSRQLTDGVSNILKTMDKVGMKNQRGYEILIQLLALKIFDEKRSARISSMLEFYKGDQEKERLDLLFYITKNEKDYISLADDNIQEFIGRLRILYNEASGQYRYILKRQDTETIVWKKESHIQIISEVVEQFQDYSFVKSHKTDLYQIVFYKFANEFSKADKGQFVTPIPLIDFLVRIVNPRSTETIIDPTSGIADFLSISYVNSDSKLDDNNIYGIDNDEQMVMLSQLNMLLNGDGNAILKYMPDKGSITWKFDDRNNLVELQPKLHKNGNWDNWKDQTKLKKFDVVLTNPPFGKQRKIEPKNKKDKEIIEMYELWDIAKSGNSIDPGIIFLENSYRILKENGRLGIVLSNSIASIDTWEKARKWFIERMRIVAIFDLPANVFADAGVNTTLIVAYKPKLSELKKLQDSNYEIYVKNITKVGYEVRTSKRVKYFNPIYRINEKNFEIEQDREGNPLLDEEFTDTIYDFKKWCLSQEKKLQDLFIKEK
ncbi:MAG: N-6 DNA methylase [Clostridiales Family XIII bacterium]|jgi:type I restriction enzyme M protein|nr:N-6 DNA methylase [Clostridiales Family XIII bacterium]